MSIRQPIDKRHIMQARYTNLDTKIHRILLRFRPALWKADRAATKVAMAGPIQDYLQWVETCSTIEMHSENPRVNIDPDVTCIGMSMIGFEGLLGRADT